MVYTPLNLTFFDLDLFVQDLEVISNMFTDFRTQGMKLESEQPKTVTDRNERSKFAAKICDDQLFQIRYRKEVLSFFSEIDLKVTKLYYIKQLY